MNASFLFFSFFWFYLHFSLPIFDNQIFIHVYRLKKKELELFAQSAEDVLRAVEESVKLQLGSSMQPSLEAVADQPSKPTCERVKIVISIQDKDGTKQFRIYTVYLISGISVFFTWLNFMLPLSS